MILRDPITIKAFVGPIYRLGLSVVICSYDFSQISAWDERDFWLSLNFVPWALTSDIMSF